MAVKCAAKQAQARHSFCFRCVSYLDCGIAVPPAGLGWDLKIRTWGEDCALRRPRKSTKHATGEGAEAVGSGTILGSGAGWVC